MIDFHTHILHDIDDGAASLDVSLEMARLALADGITTMVATPHGPGSLAGTFYSVELVHTRLKELQNALALAALPLHVLPGTELRYAHHLAYYLQQGEMLPSGNGHVLLLECPSTQLPRRLDQVIFELQIAGYTVVIAHPERIKTVQDAPDLLVPLIERGVLMQLTAGALTGEAGEPQQQLAETLLTHNMIHLLASDAHNAENFPPALAAARDHAATLIGAEAARALVEDTPAALLRGEPVDPPPPQRVKPPRRWFWSNWLHRRVG